MGESGGLAGSRVANFTCDARGLEAIGFSRSARSIVPWHAGDVFYELIEDRIAPGLHGGVHVEGANAHKRASMGVER